VLLADRAGALQPPEGPPQWGDSPSRLPGGQAGPSWASREAPSLSKMSNRICSKAIFYSGGLL